MNVRRSEPFCLSHFTSKINRNQSDISDNLDMGFDTTEEIVAEELEKQRRKLRDINATLEQQHQMLRLIVQVSLGLSYCLSFFALYYPHYFGDLSIG